ncbi:uracil-DNA glycosylase [Kiloniella sp. b19]|uniref:uracil-DNA glycosylase n=1 Tax=Kiloniella sp. GXU_MW_B19 TaxID=3141326 RepID=UPI0031D585F8
MNTSATDDGIRLEESWKAVLKSEFSKDYMKQLRSFLKEQKGQRKVIYPKGAEMFQAFDRTPFDNVRVVILGQDPYHGPNQAHGLCFSVRPGIQAPPSLVNIFKELESDLGLSIPDHGCLLPWADQGVLLLNSVLSVEQHKAASHQGRGWETFTDQAIRHLAEQREGIVFMLWGSYAQKKGAFIDRDRHLVLQSPHPSPLSAHRGFLGCRHFSQANSYLEQQGLPPINWQLPEREELDTAQI